MRSVDRVGIGDLDGDGTYDFVVKHPAGRIDPGRRVPSTRHVQDRRLQRPDRRVHVADRSRLEHQSRHLVLADGRARSRRRRQGRSLPAHGALRGDARAAFSTPASPFVLDGPEYLGVYDGETGKEIDKVDWIERGQVTDWADRSGNRSSRHMLGVAYLDGKTPSVLVVRGTYGLMKVDAWTLRNRKLEKIWRWTNERAPFKYHGQGQHSIKVGDIDGDGADEILNGSIAIDNDGRTMWGTGLGHGDRFYLSDIDPDRPGLEVWYTIEDPHPQNGVSLWDARTGTLIFGTHGADQGQPGRGRAGRRHRSGAIRAWKCWGDKFFYTAKGEPIAGTGAAAERAGLVGRRSAAGDSQQRHDREMEGRDARARRRGRCSTWPTSSATGARRSSPSSNGELRIYSTSIPATDRRVCLMQDPIYRNDVTHRSMGYPHVPMTSYYLGVRQTTPSRSRGQQR